MSKIAIGCDHGGLELKKYLVAKLNEKGYEIIDCGTYSADSTHYPIFAFAVGDLVSRKQADCGIIICRTGEGVSIAANKV
ncbi:MAG: RpiB/LacA/LacB family sugar-phosphate isomerase, partial [Bacilli bacterium]|nr:RpiB/LacA/LacB family sugar-phosphate isomerase [Bacilli bacterium]